MTKFDAVLKNRSAALLRDFEEKHQLQDVVEVISTKISHILIGTYETKEGTWLARIQPAHLYDARFKAGTFSLSIDQLDRLIEALMQVRDILSDKPTRKVQVIQSKRVPAKQAAAITQAQVPSPAQDPVLATIQQLARGLEAVMDRLEALEAKKPDATAKRQVDAQEDIERAITWQIQHSDGPYDCPICAKSYKTRGRYLTHVTEEHGIELDL